MAKKIRLCVLIGLFIAVCAYAFSRPKVPTASLYRHTQKAVPKNKIKKKPGKIRTGSWKDWKSGTVTEIKKGVNHQTYALVETDNHKKYILKLSEKEDFYDTGDYIDFQGKADRAPTPVIEKPVIEMVVEYEHTEKAGDHYGKN